MQYNPNLDNIKQGPLKGTPLGYKVEELLHDYSPIFLSIDAHGGRAFLVGGAVRDLILGLPIHDVDLEVHGLTMEQLQALLRQFGPVSTVGKSFGVLKMHDIPIDWALPRTDQSGRKPEVTINPLMGITEALSRRDLTMNALAIDLKSQVLLDPFGGIYDIKDKILRSPAIDFFAEDPLRFYRVMQFIGRFEMYPDDELQRACKIMDISAVSRERIEDEFEKLILKSRCPSLGIRWLATVGKLQEIAPELYQMHAIMQDPHWHPEGNVFEHLMQALDAAAVLAYSSSVEKLTLCYAALCHDLGKVSTTIEKDGRIKSPGHAEAGVPLARSLLRRITRKKRIIDTVCLLVKYHMQPGQFIQLHATQAAYRRLALKLSPYATIEQLGKVALADHSGRNGAGHQPLCGIPHFIKAFLKHAQEAQALVAAQLPILRGRDVMDLVKPGPEMGKILKRAYEIQLEEGIKDKEILKRRVCKEKGTK